MACQQELNALVEELYAFRDYFYVKAENRAELEEMDSAKAEARKQSELRDRSTQVLSKLDACKDKFNNSKQEIALFELLRGKVLNVLPDFDENAQQALERAVKCDPELTEAWNQLGECFWKRGDLQQARNCFETALERRRTKESLRALSMLLRQVRATPGAKPPGDGESQKMLIERSIELAKEAVSLDVRDGASWNCLATALIAQFFSFGSQNAALIQRALGAYANAEKDVRVRETAVEMHVNRSVALHYADRYAEALEALHEAMRIDPHFHAAAARYTEERTVLRDARRSIVDRGGVKKKRFEQLIESIDESTTLNGLRLQVHRSVPAQRVQSSRTTEASQSNVSASLLPTNGDVQPPIYSIPAAGDRAETLQQVNAYIGSDATSLSRLSAMTATANLGQPQLYSVSGTSQSQSKFNYAMETSTLASTSSNMQSLNLMQSPNALITGSETAVNGQVKSGTVGDLEQTAAVKVAKPGAGRELVDVTPARIADLLEGCNIEKALFCVALATIRQPNGVPLTICVADRSGTCALVNVYNVDTRRRTVSVGDRLVVLEPLTKRVRISERVFDELDSLKNGTKTKPEKSESETDAAMFEFTLLRVSSPLSLIVNGKPLETSSIAETEFRIDVQP